MVYIKNRCLKVRRSLLTTTMLVVPCVCVGLYSTPVYAQCVSSAGSVAIPTNGATVTCSANTATTTRIGNGTTDATVILEAGHDLNVTGKGVYLNNATATLGNGVRITTTDYGIHGVNSVLVTLGDDVQITASLPVLAYSGSGANRNVTLTTGESVILTSTVYGGVYADKDATVTLGKNSRIDAKTYGVFAVAGDAVVTLGEGVQINTTSSEGVYSALGDSTVTLGKNSQINSRTTGIRARNGITATFAQNASINAISGINGRGVYSPFGDINLTLGEGAQINSTRSALSGLSLGNVNVVAGTSTKIISTGNTAIVSGNNADTIDISGLVQGGAGVSMNLSGGDDILTLRSGAQLVGVVEGGANTDTLRLYGSGTEDDNFNNFEALEMNGGDWALSGTSTFGTLNVNNGILRNNGAITANVNIGANTIFGGTGTTTGNIINDGGIAPGNSIGTQNIVGNFIQNSGGLLEIEFDSSSIDLLNITGAATLDGTVSFLELNGGVTDGTTYTFLQTTGGVTGNFSTILSPVFFDPTVNIVGNNINVTLNRIATTVGAQTNSQRNVGAAIDAVLASDPSSISAISAVMNGFTSLGEASDFLSSQSGIIQSTTISSIFNAIGQNNNIVSNRLSGSSSAKSISDIQPAAGGDTDNNNSQDKDEGVFWGEFTHNFGGLDSDNNAKGSDYSMNGVIVGAEKHLDKEAIFGMFGGFSESLNNVKTLQDKSSSKIHQVGLYASKQYGEIAVNTSVSGAYIDIETTRSTALGIAKGNFNGYGGFANIEVLYDMPPLSNWSVEPAIGLEGAFIHSSSYSEKNVNVLNLAVDSQNNYQLKSILGVQMAGDGFSLYGEDNNEMLITPRIKLGWAHEFMDNASTTNVSFASSPTIIFSSQSPKRSRNEARLHFDLLAQNIGNDNIVAYGAYDSVIAKSHQNHAFTIGVKLKW